MKFNLCNTVHKDGFQFNIIPKNDILGFYSLIRWARCDLYYIFTVIDSYRQKKKQQHGSGREWESIFREWNGIFLQFFSWDWDGKRLKFVMHFGNRR